MEQYHAPPAAANMHRPPSSSSHPHHHEHQSNGYNGFMPPNGPRMRMDGPQNGRRHSQQQQHHTGPPQNSNAMMYSQHQEHSGPNDSQGSYPMDSSQWTPAHMGSSGHPSRPMPSHSRQHSHNTIRNHQGQGPQPPPHHQHGHHHQGIYNPNHYPQQHYQHRTSSYPPPPMQRQGQGPPHRGLLLPPRRSMMQQQHSHPPPRRFTFHAITAPHKLMKQQQQQHYPSSRSPSPTDIPAPPAMATLFDKNSKSASGKQDALEHQEGHAPLRQSRHQNANRPPLPLTTKDHRDDDSTQIDQVPTPKTDTASILLELRSCTSNSPATTVATVETTEQREAPPAIETFYHAPVAWIPKDYPRRLSLPGDETKLNSLHCFLRQELLEIFVVDQSICKSPASAAGSGSALGRVGLRCVHCTQARKRVAANERDEAPMGIFYPKSIFEIYRLVTSWQRCHLRKCRNLPKSVREEWEALRVKDRSRGKTAHWVTSAKQLGLVDCTSKAGGVRFSPDTMPQTQDEN